MMTRNLSGQPYQICRIDLSESQVAQQAVRIVEPLAIGVADGAAGLVQALLRKVG